MADKFFEKRKFKNIRVESFLELPEKCKDMFFRHMSRDYGSGFEPMEDYFTIADFCEIKSPIEKMFLMAFCVIKREYYDDYKIEIYPQKKICISDKTYYADFSIEYKDENPFSDGFCFELIIECDGHEFHKATKQQVKHDNERDLALKNAGYDVIHFSGSQIYENPWKCADEALSYFENKIRKG